MGEHLRQVGLLERGRVVQDVAEGAVRTTTGEAGVDDGADVLRGVGGEGPRRSGRLGTQQPQRPRQPGHHPAVAGAPRRGVGAPALRLVPAPAPEPGVGVEQPPPVAVELPGRLVHPVGQHQDGDDHVDRVHPALRGLPEVEEGAVVGARRLGGEPAQLGVEGLLQPRVAAPPGFGQHRLADRTGVDRHPTRRGRRGSRPGSAGSRRPGRGRRPGRAGRGRAGRARSPPAPRTAAAWSAGRSGRGRRAGRGWQQLRSCPHPGRR